MELPAITDFTTVPIMIVDDTKIGQVMLERVLRRANFEDIRLSRSGQAALQALEERPASVIFIDLIMPEMGGLELAQAIRMLDKSTHHFSYLIIITAQDSFESFQNAFVANIDDFVSKAEFNTHLIPRTMAGTRTSTTVNALLNNYQQLLGAFEEQKQYVTVDSETGLNTKLFALKRIEQTYRYLNARGGYLSMMVIKIENLMSFNKLAKTDLKVAIAQRLRQYFRPLDTICFLADGLYASVIHSRHPTEANTFRRVHDGLNHRAFKIYNGFANIKTTAKVVTLTKPQPELTADTLLDQCIHDINLPGVQGRLLFTNLDIPKLK